jgi:SNO glutamine amidotransferase family
VQVRTTADLDQCDALVIPGGGMFEFSYRKTGREVLTCAPESTTIALLARLSGLLDPLREFIARKPVWGTCAGAILLARSVEGAKKGGQELLGGMSITIQRNGWGSQVGLISVFFLYKLVRIVCRWNLLRHHLMYVTCGTRSALSQVYSSVHQYVLYNFPRAMGII